MQGYIFLPSPPPWGGMSKLKNREEFEGGHGKKEGKRRKKEKSDKTNVKIYEIYEA